MKGNSWMWQCEREGGYMSDAIINKNALIRWIRRECKRKGNLE